MKFYSDKNLNITTNLKESIAYNSPQDVYQIEKFIDHRIDDYGLPQLKVVWQGFEEFEAAWEPLSVLKEDVPQMVQNYLAQRGLDSNLQPL